MKTNETLPMPETLDQFVVAMKRIVLGMLEVQAQILINLKDKTENKDKAEGIQEAIDLIHKTIAMGASISDEDIEVKSKSMQAMFDVMKNNGLH